MTTLEIFGLALLFSAVAEEMRRSHWRDECYDENYRENSDTISSGTDRADHSDHGTGCTVGGNGCAGRVDSTNASATQSKTYRTDPPPLGWYKGLEQRQELGIYCIYPRVSRTTDDQTSTSRT